MTRRRADALTAAICALKTALASVVFVAVLAAVAIGGERADAPATSAAPTAIAGAAACRSCHATFHALWATSRHALAMRAYSDEFAAASLTPQTIDIVVGDAAYRAEVAPREGFVRERRGDVERRYRIAYALGGKDVVYFLTELERGRLQTLPVAYDARRREWFDMAASAARGGSAERPLDWRDRRFAFNTACGACHASQVANAYDPATDAYRTTWTEPGVNCETCHGPAQAHVDAMRAASPGEPPSDLRIIRIKGVFSHEQVNALCGSCHARAAPLTAGIAPGERFADHFELTALDDSDFYPDGRDRGEAYTLASWSQSPCVAAGGLDCLHCHTSSGRYRFVDPAKADDACQPCHAAIVADAAGHSHHPAGSPGARCVACHMPTTEFARMRRSDHSMRPPTPATSLAFGSPNACAGCHADRGDAWADAAARAWYGDYQAATLDRAALIAAARRGDWSRLDDMLALVAAPDADELTAAALTRLIAAAPEPRKWEAILGALRAASPLRRAAAAEALATLPSRQAVDALVAATADDSRLVRVRAAAALADLSAEALRLSPDQARAVAAATDEFVASLSLAPDQWTSQYGLGDLYLARGDAARAADAFETAMRLDPSAAPPLIAAAIADARLGRNDKAEAALVAALKLEPDNPAAHFNLGLLRAGLDDATAAERHLRAALAARPDMAEAAYNLGLLLASDRPAEGLDLLRRAATLDVDEPRYAYALAFSLAAAGDRAEATRILNDLLARRPDYRPAAQLRNAMREGR